MANDKEKYVKLTKEKLKSLFAEYNEKYFNNELITPKYFELWTCSKYCAGWIRGIWNVRDKRYYTSFHISNEFNWLENELRDVIVHEMIHLSIRDYLERVPWWKKPFHKSHDKRFVRKMKELNEKFGLNIMIMSKHLQQYMKNPD